MRDEYYKTPELKKLLEANKMDSFESIWSLDTEWFEPPNYRRDGWSGVIKCPLQDASGKTVWFFIKRQENHNCKTFLHPIKGVPTFRREFDNIQHLSNKNIPSLTAVYYNERHQEGKIQAILITLSLEDYQSFEHYCTQESSEDERLKVMSRAGVVIRKLHDAHYRHNCLYAKHLFVKADEKNIDVKLIDLEKLKWLPFYSQIRRNDLSRIIRRGEPMTLVDLKTILDSYYSEGKNLKNTPLAKELNGLLSVQTRY
ncbi:MAG: inaA protein [Gammaproteobacteria bacterium]|nr:inaA protein [Gammaproteobacteria bacterium]